MRISPDVLSQFSDGYPSMRAAWRSFQDQCYHISWDSFRKQMNAYALDFKKEVPVKTTETLLPKKKKVGLALYDLHIPHEDQTVIDLAIDYVKYRLGFARLDYLILGGDIVTFDSVSRWSKDPFEVMPLHEELSYAREVLIDIVERLNPVETIYIKGNHEDRLERFLVNKAPEISRLNGLTVPEQLGLEELGITWVDNLQRKVEGKPFYKIGQLNVLHGQEILGCPSINPARRYFMKTFAPTILGHVHKVDEHFERTVEDKIIGTWVCGCSCKMNQGYLPHNNWGQGFAVIEWEEDGYFTVDLKKVIDGRVL